MSKTTTVAEESTRPDPDAADARPVDDGPTAEADDTADWRTEADDRLTEVKSADGSWAVAAALAIAGIGFVVGSPVLLAGATIPLWYTAVASLGGRPETRIAAHRALVLESDAVDATRDTKDADDALSGNPGDVVTVRTTLYNAGDQPAVDLRVVDGVPDALPVVEGTPRTCVTLEPGEETTLEYGVELQRGEHEFAEPAMRGRSLTGATRIDWESPVAGGEQLVCSPAVANAPLGTGRNDYAGEVPTDEGGSGVEFHSVRDYEPGDPVRSIDWRRYANTRELATVEYRAERSTRILCVVDARSSQELSPAGSTLSTLELCADAAERTAGRLLTEGHPTGVAAMYSRRASFVPPGTGSATREHVTGFLQTLSGDEDDVSVPSRELYDEPATAIPRVVPGETQVYLFSSFVDEAPLDLVERLRLQGYSVCVVAPAVSGDAHATPAGGRSAGAGGDGSGVSVDSDNPDVTPLATRLAGIDRDTRLAHVRATGATVVEWDLDRSLGLVLDRALGVVG
ncbi:DUF58 domain-containing protein [Halobacteriales archaeon SW_7_65_23]|nr:MAG: DUF58 domain-containing protein [Halobacteriales archaeon SW_7_65_23]